MRRDQFIRQVEALGKDVFNARDLKRLFPDEAQLNISVKRMSDAGIILPVTRGVYTLARGSLDIEKTATQLYYPSYISFECALSRYGVIDQGLYGLTLATTRHSRKITLAGVDCAYSQLKAAIFFGFDLLGGTYVAQAEKALLDMLYLMVFGKRSGNVSGWNLDGLDALKVNEFAKFFPKSVQKQAALMGF
jgi:predicted transcriptional regulator of viral defense system